MAGDGDITVWINSPGGDCVAAAQIYNMLMDYPHNVTVKIDGIAASAASVIAMAGTKVLVSPVSMMMIHNPMTVAMGDTAEMQKAIEMLGSVKDSIINAYEIKTGLSRAKLSHLMDAETWMDAGKAVELGFADDVLARAEIPEDMEPPAVSMLYSKAAVVNSLMDKIAAKCKTKPKTNFNKSLPVLWHRTLTAPFLHRITAAMARLCKLHIIQMIFFDHIINIIFPHIIIITITA